MKYDVFISYSRKDSAVADKVCAAFDRAGISYFIDRQGIGGGFEFPRVLAENIIDSQLFLLLASENAYASKFTTNEIIFAFNKKPKHSILPYIIDGSSLPLELEFTFAGINWRNITDHPIDSVLVTDILALLGKPAKITQSAPAPEKKQPKEYEKPQPKPGCKTYKVGDYYNENGKEGVVFDVLDGGLHGKILSLDQKKLQWRIKEQLYNKQIVLGVKDNSDGKANTDKVMARSDADQYPAFAWCRNKGKDWYLPAIDELKLILLNDSVYDAVNKTIAQKGGTKLCNKGTFERYWSSTEIDEFHAWLVAMYNGGTHKIVKGVDDNVRAVSEF